MRIRLTPIAKRAHNRVREHGDVFSVLIMEPDRILVTALGMTPWWGWFRSDEATWEVVAD